MIMSTGANKNEPKPQAFEKKNSNEIYLFSSILHQKKSLIPREYSR